MCVFSVCIRDVFVGLFVCNVYVLRVSCVCMRVYVCMRAYTHARTRVCVYVHHE